MKPASRPWSAGNGLATTRERVARVVLPGTAGREFRASSTTGASREAPAPDRVPEKPAAARCRSAAQPSCSSLGSRRRPTGRPREPRRRLTRAPASPHVCGPRRPAGGERQRLHTLGGEGRARPGAGRAVRLPALALSRTRPSGWMGESAVTAEPITTPDRRRSAGAASSGAEGLLGHLPDDHAPDDRHSPRRWPHEERGHDRGERKHDRNVRQRHSPSLRTV